MLTSRSNPTMAFVGLVLALAATVLVLTGPPSATADGYGGCLSDPNEGCRADNKVHTYCFTPAMDGDGFQAAGTYALNNLVAQTDFTKDFVACGGNTDVVFKRLSLGPGAYGYYECQEWIPPTSKCDRATVVLDPKVANVNVTQRRAFACHEIGHSGGLRHGALNDCMINGFSDNVHYNGHHVAHLINQD